MHNHTFNVGDILSVTNKPETLVEVKRIAFYEYIEVQKIGSDKSFVLLASFFTLHTKIEERTDLPEFLKRLNVMLIRDYYDGLVNIREEAKAQVEELKTALLLEDYELILYVRKNIEQRSWLYRPFEGVRFKNPIQAFDDMEDNSYDILSTIMVRQCISDNSYSIDEIINKINQEG